ncbi:hypothetical protein [robinz microvirus RP_35]|nr:hypothetical protein [robinz microvirus RP_35]
MAKSKTSRRPSAKPLPFARNAAAADPSYWPGSPTYLPGFDPSPASPSFDYSTQLPPGLLQEIEDRRTFYPDRYRPAAGLQRNVNRIRPSPRRTLRQTQQVAFLPHREAFQHPELILTCIRRKIRREVMHALGMAGRAGRGRKTRRRNAWTGISC